MSVAGQMPLKDVKNDLESLEQTLDILSRPALIKQIRESLNDLKNHDVLMLSKDEALALVERS